jgi:hypothetical protein
LKIAYGYSVQPTGDPLVTLANDALDKFSQTTLLGEFPVDIFPIRRSLLTRQSIDSDNLFLVRHVPSWVPGVKFKKLAREWKQLGIDLFDKPFDYVKSQMVVTNLNLLRLFSHYLLSYTRPSDTRNCRPFILLTSTRTTF